MVEEIKNRTVYTAPIQVFSPGSKPRKSSIFGPFRPKTLCLDPHFRVGDPLSDHQNRFFTCKNSKSDKFFSFWRFSGRENITPILRTYVRLTKMTKNTGFWVGLFFFIWHPGKSAKAQHPRVAALPWGRTSRGGLAASSAARGVFQSPCPTQSRTGKFWKMGIFVNRIWPWKGVICRFQTSKNEHILRENVCILWEFWWCLTETFYSSDCIIWIFVMFHQLASYL